MISFDNIVVKDNFLNDSDKNENTHYKLIILVIASIGEPYDTFLRCWKEVVQNSDSNWGVKCFFVFSDPSLSVDLSVSDDTIIYKCEESLRPGILFKTIAAMWYCNKTFSYDYILRTNLSSFFHIPRLLSILETQSPTNIIATPIQVIVKNEWHINIMWHSYWEVFEKYFTKDMMDNLFHDFFPFFDGAGFILSRDIMDMFLHSTLYDNVFMNLDNTRVNFFLIPDDVLLSMMILRLLHEKQILYNIINIVDYFKICNSVENPTDIPENIFFIRNKTNQVFENREIDILNFANQIRYFYNRFDFSIKNK